MPFKVFYNPAKIGAWNAPSSDLCSLPAHRHPLTAFPPALLLQYFALLLCIFLLEVLAGVLAYIYYQQVKPLQSTDCFKSPLTYICARCEKSQIKSLFVFFCSGSSRVASRGSGWRKKEKENLYKSLCPTFATFPGKFSVAASLPNNKTKGTSELAQPKLT